MGLYGLRILATASMLWVFALLPIFSEVYKTTFLCMLFGVFGGSIVQFLTWDKRRPKWPFFIGDLLSSSVMGMGVFVGQKLARAATGMQAQANGDNVEMFFACIIAGALGSGGFLAYVNAYRPHLLKDAKKEDAVETET